MRPARPFAIYYSSVSVIACVACGSGSASSGTSAGNAGSMSSQSGAPATAGANSANGGGGASAGGGGSGALGGNEGSSVAGNGGSAGAGAGGAAGAAGSAGAIATPPGYTFEWSDEFDGPNIDETIWTIVDRAGTAGNKELQYYTARKNAEPGANVFIADGALVIEAREESWKGFNYTSARLNTLASPIAQFEYGRMEAKAKLPDVTGMWPAFWMEGINEAQVGWPVGGEIDIMEGKGRLPNWCSGALHRSLTPGAGADIVSSQAYTLPSGNFHDDWHVFAAEWDAQQIRWYVDSTLTQTVSRPTSAGAPWPFDQPFYFLLNLAVGGNFDGGQVPPAGMPAQRYYVDYVRVFKKAM